MPGCQDIFLWPLSLLLHTLVLWGLLQNTPLNQLSLELSTLACATTYIHQPLPAQFLAALAALYLPFVFVVVFGATLEFETWDPSDIWSVGCLDKSWKYQKLKIPKVKKTKSWKDVKLKRQKVEKTKSWTDKKLKRQKLKKTKSWKAKNKKT